jgi:hypothetical protein
MKSKKYRKLKRKTRRGGLFNIKKTKSEEDNIKDWYLYWRKKGYSEYNSTIRYPGYYNLNMEPEYGRTRQQSIQFPEFCNSSDPKLVELCAVNITGKNKQVYDRDWTNRDGGVYQYSHGINWVNKLNMEEPI